MVSVVEVKENAYRMASAVEGYRPRREYNLVTRMLSEDRRVQVIRGFRGSGKTTLLLQLFLEDPEKRVYVNTDSPHVFEEGIYNVGKEMVRSGHNTLLLDEVHVHSDWEQGVKALHDEHPNVRIVVSGSAPLVFTPSRRFNIIDLDFLSLSHFIYLDTGKNIYSEKEWRSLEDSLRFLARNPEIEESWPHYVYSGLPSFFGYKRLTPSTVYASIIRSVREDAVFFRKVDGEKVAAMEKILLFLATSSPGELSINALSNSLDLSKDTVSSLITLLEKMMLLRFVRPFARGHSLIRGFPKLMFRHPCLRIAICNELGEGVNQGAVREEQTVFSLQGRGWKVYTVKGKKRSPDYHAVKGREKIMVEVGGASKSRAQLKGFNKGMLLSPPQIKTLSLF